MAEILKGKDVSDSLSERTAEKVGELKKHGIFPTLAIVRLGENPGDVAYERGAVKRAFELGITVRQFVYDAGITQEDLEDEIRKLNEDEHIHGVLIFRPLPAHIDEKAICGMLDPEKDVDGITAGSMAGVFTDSDAGFPPCTAEACMELLAHYGYELEGKRVAVIGRSLVIGRPVAMMAMRRNATVTICHSRTSSEALADIVGSADIVIAAVGSAAMVKGDILGCDQIVVDVGINVAEDGSLQGDVDFDGVADKVSAITPVPGGVGSVTTAVLMKHVAEAAENAGK